MPQKIRVKCSYCGAPRTISAVEPDDSPLGQFITERCVLIETARTPMTVLLDAFDSWMSERRMPTPPAKFVGLELRRMGVGAAKSNGRRIYTGIQVTGSDSPPGR